MAGQSPSRRQVLQAFSLAALAGAAPGFSRWCFALDEHHRGELPYDDVGHPPSGEYVPQFFKLNEYQTIDVLTELILPSDSGPGAREAGVSEFIDFIVGSDSSLQAPFRGGLEWLDKAAAAARGRCSFAALSEAQQKNILDRLAYRKNHRPEEKVGQVFFSLVRKYTVMGFYTTKIGLEALDFPGLKFYAASPECTHPEHREHSNTEGTM
jgi:hypothetical protein